MTEWNTQQTDKFYRDYKHYEKKHREELLAVLANLQDYMAALSVLDNPLLVTAGFIHHEPKGIKAIDQKGGQKKIKLQQTRLYSYADEKSKTLHLLAIGDKRSQREDIQFCVRIVEEITSGRNSPPE